MTHPGRALLLLILGEVASPASSPAWFESPPGATLHGIHVPRVTESAGEGVLAAVHRV